MKMCPKKKNPLQNVHSILKFISLIKHHSFLEKEIKLVYFFLNTLLGSIPMAHSEKKVSKCEMLNFLKEKNV